MKSSISKMPALLLAAVLGTTGPVSSALDTARLIVDLDKPGHPVPPTLHGLFFEDINYAGDGGLYAELVQNRSVEDRNPLLAWEKHEAVLPDTASLTNARLVVLAADPGVVDVDMVSLFPRKTFKNRRNGLRDAHSPTCDKMNCSTMTSATAGGMRTTVYRRRSNSSLPTMARFEMGEVLLTTSMSEVFLCLGQSVLPGNPAFRERDAEGVLIQIGHASALAERQPAGGVEAAGQFDLHVSFPFPRPEGQGRQGLLVKIKGHTHRIRFSTAILTGIFAKATAEGFRNERSGNAGDGTKAGPVLGLSLAGNTCRGFLNRKIMVKGRA